MDGSVQENKNTEELHITEIKENTQPRAKIPGSLIALLLSVCIVVSLLSGAGGAFAVYKFLTPKDTVSESGASQNTEKNTVEKESIGDTVEIIPDEPNTFLPELPESESADVPDIPSDTPDSSTGLSKGQIYAEAVNSIVSISAKWDEVYSTILGNYYQPVESTGTGFIVTEDGYIITNYHVVKKAEDITVTDYDGNEYKATIVGSEASNDVAVLKIDAEVTPVVLGNSSDLAVGDDIMVIGNALGELSYTFTDGIVSHLSRTLKVESGETIHMFQTNAAINNGNSGGPVYNMQGEVVGIASAKYASETIEGLGFCIPIDDVKEMISDIIIYGYVTDKPSLDVSLQSIDPSMASRYSIVTGCYVVAIDNDGAAFNAGIRNKDVITVIGDKEIASCDDVWIALSDKSAGDSVDVAYWREGTTYYTNITLSEDLPSEPRTSYSNVYDF